MKDTRLPRRIKYLSLEEREKFYNTQQTAREERKRSILGEQYYENKKPRRWKYPLFVIWYSIVKSVEEGKAMQDAGCPIPPLVSTFVFAVK